MGWPTADDPTAHPLSSSPPTLISSYPHTLIPFIPSSPHTTPPLLSIRHPLLHIHSTVSLYSRSFFIHRLFPLCPEWPHPSQEGHEGKQRVGGR